MPGRGPGPGSGPGGADGNDPLGSLVPRPQAASHNIGEKREALARLTAASKPEEGPLLAVAASTA